MHIRDRTPKAESGNRQETVSQTPPGGSGSPRKQAEGLPTPPSTPGRFSYNPTGNPDGDHLSTGSGGYLGDFQTETSCLQRSLTAAKCLYGAVAAVAYFAQAMLGAKDTDPESFKYSVVTCSVIMNFITYYKMAEFTVSAFKILAEKRRTAYDNADTNGKLRMADLLTLSVTVGLPLISLIGAAPLFTATIKGLSFLGWNSDFNSVAYLMWLQRAGGLLYSFSALSEKMQSLKHLWKGHRAYNNPDIPDNMSYDDMNPASGCELYWMRAQALIAAIPTVVYTMLQHADLSQAFMDKAFGYSIAKATIDALKNDTTKMVVAWLEAFTVIGLVGPFNLLFIAGAIPDLIAAFTDFGSLAYYLTCSSDDNWKALAKSYALSFAIRAVGLIIGYLSGAPAATLTPTAINPHSHSSTAKAPATAMPSTAWKPEESHAAQMIQWIIGSLFNYRAWCLMTFIHKHLHHAEAPNDHNQPSSPSAVATAYTQMDSDSDSDEEEGGALTPQTQCQNACTFFERWNPFPSCSSQSEAAAAAA